MVAVYTAFQILTASELNAAINFLYPVTAEKLTGTPRTSVTSRTADPDLTLSLPASSTWDIDGLLLVQSATNAAGDISSELQYPADATASGGGAGLHNSLASGSQSDLEGNASSADATSPNGPFPYGASTATTGIIVKQRVKMVSAGTVAIAWAQQASNPSATTLMAGSWITARRAA